MKNFFYNIFCILGFVLLLTVSSCEIGLGASVDTDPPEMNVSLPVVNSVIRGDVAFRGTYEDDGEISDIGIVLKRTDAYTQQYSYAATLTPSTTEAGKGTWSCIIDPTKEDSKIIDGPYEATITIIDKAGHKSTITRGFTIDNTPPLVVLQRPGSVVNDTTDIDSYGQTFTLTGQAADDNNVSLIEIMFYSDASCSEESYLDTVQLQNVPPTIELDVAKFGASDGKYEKIYGSTEKVGTKQLYCKIIAYDGACVYPTDGSNQTVEDLKGNSTTTYYLYADIADSILSKYKITDIYHMQNGIYSLANNSSRSAIADITTILNGNEKVIGKFTLNPTNNPTFKVTGKTELTKNGTDFENEDYSITKDSSVFFEVSPGLDGILLNADSLSIYAVECDTYGNKKADKEPIEIEVKKQEKSGSTYKIEGIIKAAPDKFQIGHNYIFGVNGKDARGNEIVPNVTNGYGFHFSTTGKQPELEITTPKNLITYVKRDDKISISGTVIVEDGDVTLTIQKGNDKIYDEILTNGETTENQNKKYTFTIGDIGFENSEGSKQYDLKITATNDGRNQTVTKTIYYDIDGPGITINSISPTALNYLDNSGNIIETDSLTDENEYINGIIVLKLNISDNINVVTEGENKPKLELKQNDVLKETYIITSPANQTLEIDTTDLEDNQDVDFVITAYDTAGNKTELKEIYKVKQSTDFPVIIPASATWTKDITTEEILGEHLDQDDNRNIFTTGSNLKIKLIDDDGLKSLNIYSKKGQIAEENLESTKVETFSGYPTETTYDYGLPADLGGYTFKFVVKDQNDKETKIGPFYISVIGNGPTLTIETEKLYLRNGDDVKVTGIVNGSTAPYKVFRCESNGTPIGEALTCDNNGRWVFENKITAGNADKLNKIYFKAQDKYNKFSGVQTFEYVEDNTPPVVNLTALPNKEDTKFNSFTIKGSASEDGENASGVEEIWIKFTGNGKTKTYKVSESRSINYPLTYSNETDVGDDGITWKQIFANQGEIQVFAYAKDKAGNNSTEFKINNSGAYTDNSPAIFIYDTQDPTITITSGNDRKYMPTTGIQVSGIIQDSYKLADVNTLIVKEEKDTGSGFVETNESKNSEKNKVSLTNKTDTNADWSITLPLNRENLTEATYRYTFIVLDEVGNRVESTPFTSTVDTISPVITITAPVNSIGINAISSTTYQFKGGISGENSLCNVYWAINDTENAPETPANNEVLNESSWTSKGYELATSSLDNWSFFKNFDSERKDFYVHIFAVDGAGNKSDEVHTKFDVDYDIPEIQTQYKVGNNEPITLENNNTVTTTSAYTLRIKAQDSNALATNNAVEIAVKKNNINLTKGENGYSVSEPEDDWYTVDITGTAQGDGLYTYTITATDIVGKTNSVTRSIKLDTIAPEIEIISPSFAGYQNAASINIIGSAQDDSGVAAVYWASKAEADSAPEIPNNSVDLEASWTAKGWTKAEGTSSWTVNGATTTEGNTKTLYFAAVDVNGLYTQNPVQKTFKVDLYNPTFEETSIGEGKAYKKENYVLSGTASDSGSEINSIIITGDGNTYAWYKDNSLGTTTNGFNYNAVTGEWSYTVSVDEMAEGEKQYILTATDGANKITTLSRKVVYDKTKPIIAEITNGNWYKTRTITVQPEITEDGAGIDLVEVSIIDNSVEDASRNWQELPLSSGNYKGSVEFDTDGESLNYYIRATDRAGNVSDERTVTVKVDTTEPNLDKLRYNVGSTNVKDVGGTVYVNNTNSITVYGSYSDDLSGVKELSFIGTVDNVQPEVTYSTGTIEDLPEGSRFVENLTFVSYNAANTKTIKYWKAVFSQGIIQSGTLYVKGTNNAGGVTTEKSLFQVVKDTEAPTLSNIKINTDSESYNVYLKENTYYLNNIGQKFTITGLAEDNISVDKIELTITNTADNTKKIEPNPSNTVYFEDIEFKTGEESWTGGAIAVIRVTDIAGNESVSENINIVFDTEGPEGIHVIDTKNKDLFFRIGEQARDDGVKTDTYGDLIYDGTVESGPDWDNDLDRDVGGKYSSGTFGNTETVKIRGKFEDKESGVDLIYYKIYTIEPDKVGTVVGSESTQTFLNNYKNLADGYFSVFKNSEEEERRVFYTDNKDNGTLGGNIKAEDKELFSGNKYYTTIKTNYKTTIPGLTVGYNYLVLVAVDKVGNARLEDVIVDANEYHNYQLNVDNEPPTVVADNQVSGEFTNADSNLEITGSVSDNPISVKAGIKDIYVKCEDKKIKADISDDGTWTATIPKATLDDLYGTHANPTSVTKLFTITATDKAGTGNTASTTVSVTIDKENPSVEITGPRGAGTNNSGVTMVNGEIVIKGNASDKIGLTDNTLELYYTTNASEKDGVNSISNWIKYTGEPNGNGEWTLNTTNGTTFTDQTTYYFTVKATDKAGNTSYATPITLEVNKDSDRPVVKFYIEFTNNITSSVEELSGVISDDDGTPGVNNVWYAITDGNVTTVPNNWGTADGNTFKYDNTGAFTVKPGDGSKRVWFKINDGKNDPFISSATSNSFNTVKLIDKDGNNPTTNTVLTVKTDTRAPSAEDYAYLEKGGNAEKDEDWKTTWGYATFGGTLKDTFKVQVYAYDDNGIDGVTFKVPRNDSDSDEIKATAVQDASDNSKYYYEYELVVQNGKTKVLNGATHTCYRSGDINLEGLVSGQRICIMDVDDGTKHKTETIVFTVDNTAPEATFTSHKDEEQIGASFILKGGFNNSDTQNSLKYILSLDNTAPSDDDWEEAKEVRGTSSATWVLNFDGIADSPSLETTHDSLPKGIVAALVDNVIIAETGTNQGKAVYETAADGHDAGELYTNLTMVYFHMLATDEIGNSAHSYWKLKLDPQGDIPTIEMAYPTAEEQDTVLPGTTNKMYAKLSGKIRAQGSAEDDKTIKGIYMQIDPNYNPASGFDDANWNTKNCPNGKTLAENGYTLQDMGTVVAKATGKLGIKVGESPSWNITLNSTNEFNAATAGNINYIAIKFYAVDEDGNISIWDDKDLVIVAIDADAPKFGSSEPFYLYQYGFKENATGTVYYAQTSEPNGGDQLYTDSACNNAAVGKTYNSTNYESAIASVEYTENMWLKGVWYLKGSVEDESGIKSLTVDGNSITASSTAISDGYRVNFRVGSNESNSYGNMSYTISATDETDKSGDYTIKIRYDNKAPVLANDSDTDYKIDTEVVNEDGFYKVQSVVTEDGSESGFDKVIFYFKRGTKVYDSYMPKGHGNELDTTNLIEQDNIWWKENTVTAIDGRNITIAADDNTHKGGLIKVGGVIYTITGINDNKTIITLSGSPSESVLNTNVYISVGHVVDHEGTETEGTTKNTNKEAYGYGYYNNSSDDDGDLMMEKVSFGTTRTIWYGLINSRNISDGGIEIHYVAFDKAGNMSYGHVDNASVKNNAPRLSGLRVWTDFNGNGGEDAEESDTKFYKSKDRRIDGKYQAKATGLTSNFVVTGNDKSIEDSATAFMRVTDKTKFYPEIVGGNGALYYSYKIGTGINPDNWTNTGNSGNTPFSNGTSKEYSDDSSEYMTTDQNGDSYIDGYNLDGIEVSTDTLNSLGNGEKWFEYTIWDSTGGNIPFNADKTVNSPTLNAKFTVLLNIAYQDTQAPVAEISPFYWKSASDNSLYKNSKSNGHIELEGDLNNTIKGLYGDDPKVSGKITIRGTAYDNVRLSQLWVKFDDIALDNSRAGENPDGTGHANYVLASEYKKGSGWLNATATMETNGWEFNAKDSYCNKDGHSVDWELSINTAKVAGVAVLDKNVYVMAVDERATGTNHYSSATESQDNKPSYQMDIVPYVTGISTTKRNKSGLKDNNIRSASGKYSVMYAASTTATTYAADFITVSGFNLNPSAVRVVDSSIVSTKTVSGTSGIAVTSSNVASDYTSFTASNVISKSGYLEVFTSDVRALNNINNNDSYGSAFDEAPASPTAAQWNEYYYNREPDLYTTKNVQLTDDRYLRFFDMKKTNVINGYYPNMVMEGDNPVFGYIDNNGGGGGPNTAPASTAFYQRAKYNGSTAAEIYKEYLGKSLVGDQMAMAKDDDGRYYQLSVGNYSGDYMTMYYDRYAELYTNSNVWCGATQYQNFNGDYATTGNNNAIALDTIQTYIGRFQYPKVIAKGGSRTGTASVYMSYYDSQSGNIYIRNFMLGTTNLTGSESGVRNRLGNSGSDNNGNAFAQYINFAEGTTDYSARHTVVSGSGNKFFDMTITNDNHIVVVYYDEDSSRLKMRYSTNVEKGSNPTNDIAWSDFEGELPEYVGNYVSITSDSVGGIHISAFDVTDSDLSYIYIPKYNEDNYVHVSVDQFGSVGNWTKIQLNSAGIPYIAYCNATEYGQRDAIKIAYAASLEDAQKAGVADNTRYTTGSWEYMTVPTITPAQGGDSKFQQVCLDFDSNGLPVVGYLGDNLEFGKWLTE